MEVVTATGSSTRCTNRPVAGCSRETATAASSRSRPQDSPREHISSASVLRIAPTTYPWRSHDEQTRQRRPRLDDRPYGSEAGNDGRADRQALRRGSRPPVCLGLRYALLGRASRQPALAERLYGCGSDNRRFSAWSASPIYQGPRGPTGDRGWRDRDRYGDNDRGTSLGG